MSVAVPNLSEVRTHYMTAAESLANSNKFSELLSSVDKSDSKILVAYKGAATALNAKYAARDQKKANFIEGVSLLEFAAKAEPNNLEIRLIRLSIQENTPKILNYKKNITTDKAFIMQHLRNQNAALQSYARAYIKRSKVFSASEKISLQ